MSDVPQVITIESLNRKLLVFNENEWFDAAVKAIAYAEQLQRERDKLRDALEEALDAWAAKLCMMPDIRGRERLDAARNVLEGVQDD